MIYRTLLTALLSVLLAGCSTQQTAAKIVISDGCLITIDGLSTQQADDVLRNWNIDKRCEIEVRATGEQDDET